VRARYLIVDGHSMVFAWPELHKLHGRRPSLAREALLKRLRDYQDWSGKKVVAVFDGQGSRVSEMRVPHDVQVFYARHGQSADAVIERLACKYASRFDVTVATSDLMEMQTVNACGAACISPAGLRELLEAAPKG
jgi:predicted RNA-binding protein with PIN domain